MTTPNPENSPSHEEGLSRVKNAAVPTFREIENRAMAQAARMGLTNEDVNALDLLAAIFHGAEGGPRSSEAFTSEKCATLRDWLERAEWPR